MTFDIFRKTAPSVFVLALAAAPVLAQEAWNDWDADGDNMWSEEEFGAGFGETDAFDVFDEDGDALLDEEEYVAGFGDDYEGDADMFGDYDLDGDGYYNEEEFVDATFAEYDEDDDGFLNEEEQGFFVEETEEDDWF